MIDRLGNNPTPKGLCGSYGHFKRFKGQYKMGEEGADADRLLFLFRTERYNQFSRTARYKTTLPGRKNDSTDCAEKIQKKYLKTY